MAESPHQIPLVTLVHEDEIEPETIGQLFGTFRSKRQAIEALREIVDTHHLCPKLMGLESGNGTCFAHQLKRCKGVCAGKEAPEIHFLRLQQAMVAHRLKAWPYPGRIGIHERHPVNQKTQMHVFEHWVHVATVEDENDLRHLVASKSELIFDLDTYRLLIKELNKPHVKIIKLAECH